MAGISTRFAIDNSKSLRFARDAEGLVVFIARRFFADRGVQVASSLTFTSLLALVPLITIVFAMFAAFPAFSGLREQLQEYVFSNFVPQVGDVVLEHLRDFASEAGSTTAVGVIFLGVTSLMLLVTIERCFNQIWRVRKPRPLLTRLLGYWALLTLAPFLFGASLSLSGILFTVVRSTGVEEVTLALARISTVVPLLLVIAGFSLIYFVLPNFPVQRKHALIGGTFAGFLFNALKWAFSYYVVEVASYQQVYGALAAIPIFLMWMYVSWVIVIMGAELAAALPEWAAGRRATDRDVASVRRLEVAVAVLARLHRQSRDKEGGPVPDFVLMRDVGVGADLLDSVIEALLRAGFIARAAEGGWLLARDLEQARLYDLFEVLGFSLGRLPSPMAGDHVWHKRFLAAIDKLEAANREALDTSLRVLLAPEPAVVGELDAEPAPEPVSLRS